MDTHILHTFLTHTYTHPTQTYPSTYTPYTLAPYTTIHTSFTHAYAHPTQTYHFTNMPYTTHIHTHTLHNPLDFSHLLQKSPTYEMLDTSYLFKSFFQLDLEASLHGENSDSPRNLP